ncbi:MAG TPA: helix-turn-helix domain-containing protein [Solirubrobacteraceae bacterium]|nr:helix-turn-helix domain-containing protein [Solirubrobacteraceae bacterium]
MSQAIAISLTRGQVNRVVQQAAASGSAADLPALLPGPDELVRRLARAVGDPNYSQSLIRAVQVLAALPADGSARELGAIAKAVGFSTSTVHRYLQTWVALDVVMQDGESRRYIRPASLARPVH